MVTDNDGCTYTITDIVISTNLDTSLIYQQLDLCDNQLFTLFNGATTNVTGTYNFQYVGQNNCDSIHVVRVEFTPQTLYIPNVFSPDKDGLNDFFTIFADMTCITEIAYLRIYDRWGSLIFQREKFQPNVEYLGWDGSLSGKESFNTGVYTYDTVLQLANGNRVSLQGDVTIIK